MKIKLAILAIFVFLSVTISSNAFAQIIVTNGAGRTVSKVDFGFVPLGAAAVEFIVITNYGNTILHNVVISARGDNFAASGCGQIFPQGHTCNLNIEFRPDRKGKFNDLLKIKSGTFLELVRLKGESDFKGVQAINKGKRKN